MDILQVSLKINETRMVLHIYLRNMQRSTPDKTRKYVYLLCLPRILPTTQYKICFIYIFFIKYYYHEYQFKFINFLFSY